MTKLIPLDAAIAAVYHADSFELSLCGTSRIEERIELIPTIDPAAIREAALREAAAVIIDIRDRHGVMPSRYEIMPQRWRDAILALIGEKK